MARINLRNVMSDLSRKYAWDNGASIEEMAHRIFDKYKHNLGQDMGGCYVLAFEWAEKQGLIRPKPRPTMLELDAQNAPAPVERNQTVKEYIREYDRQLQNCEK